MHKTLHNSLLLALFSAISLYADSSDTQSISLDALTVSASPVHEHEAFEVPAQVDTINSTEITQKSTASLGKILEDIPGVNNIATGSQSGKPVIRGMSGERVKIVSNGSATDFQTYGIRHLANIDPFFAQNIEVVRGAQGVLYGSDALGGVVNVISPKLLSTSDDSVVYKGELAGEYNTNNNEWMSGIKAQIAKGKFGLNVGVSKREADNYKTASSPVYKSGDPAGTLPLFSGELPYTNFENTSAFIALGYIDEWGEVSLQHTYWQSYQNFLGHLKDLTPVSSAGQDLSNNETQLKGEIFAGEWIIKPMISHTINTREAATNTPYEIMDSVKGTDAYVDLDVDRTDAKLAFIHPTFAIFDGEIGIEGYDKDQTLNNGKLSPSAKEKGLGLYIFEEADIGEWIFQGGLRYSKIKIDAPTDGNNAPFVASGIFDASNNSKKFSAIAGSIGATYKLNTNFNIAVNISRGFRAPSIFELYAGGVHGGVQAYQLGNPNLKEEISLGGDIALRYKDEKTKASITLYHTYIDNYIFLQNTGNSVTVGSMVLPEMKNEQTDATMQGIEFAFDTMLSKKTRATGTFEIIKGRDTKNNRSLPLIPANNLKLAIYQNLGNLAAMQDSTLFVDYKYVDDQQVGGTYEPFAQYNNTPFGTADTQSYSLWGVGYTSDIDIFEHKPQLSIKISNLFDKEYRDFLDTYKGYALGMGRNISFSLRVPFES
ncbi:MAG: TonB-dependent receptor [Sulfurimonas sp.]|nr:MAG: TonB-dependent receptor [Sulfurimonas sp.]